MIARSRRSRCAARTASAGRLARPRGNPGSRPWVRASDPSCFMVVSLLKYAFVLLTHGAQLSGCALRVPDVASQRSRMSFNLATMLRESQLADPAKALCHLGEVSFSYAQVDEMSGRVAASLRALGLARGDKVAVQLPNLPQFLFTYFGILKAGLVMVPLNPLLKAPEVAYHLKDSDAKLLVTFEMFAAEAFKGATEAGGVTTYVVNMPGNDVRPEGTKHYDELYFADDTRDIVPLGGDDTAVLLHTSGTTGKPKGAELTHFQLFMNCTTAGGLFGFKEDDVGLAVLLFFHVFGLSSVLNVCVRYAGTL